MKVLVVAELRMGSLGLSYLNAFKNLGHEVYEFDLAKELNNKYLNRLFSGLLYRNVNRKLLEKIKVIKPELVFIIKGVCIFPKTLLEIKNQLKIRRG